MADLLPQLEAMFKRCSDCGLHPEYKPLLKQLETTPLSAELVNYLCDKATSKKHWPGIRFAHLRILLLNETSRSFDLKQWYLDGFKKSRLLWLRLAFLRGYAMYAAEHEMIPLMKKFSQLMQGKQCGYEDWAEIMAESGLPHLVKTYGYPCIFEAWEVAKAEHLKLSPLLRNLYTSNERMETVMLVSPEEMSARLNAFCSGQNAAEPSSKAE